MKAIAPLLALVSALLLAGGALAQPGHGRGGDHAQRHFQRSMPPAERRMGYEERQRMREQVRSGNMSREEARERWREERERRARDPARLEQRERLRRDIQEANQHLPRR